MQLVPECSISLKFSLLYQNSSAYRAGYVMPMSKCIRLQIMLNSKSVEVRIYGSIVQGTVQKSFY